MAADVLLYKWVKYNTYAHTHDHSRRATHVPVGDDQLQHLELTRDIARSFNSTFGETFPEPKPLLNEFKRVMSLRNPLQKMSKSDNQDMSRISLSDTPDEITKKIRRAVTDSIGNITFDPDERPGVSNLVMIYSAVMGVSCEEVCSQFEGRQSVDLKEKLAEILVDTLGPIRERIEQLERDDAYVEEVLRKGAERAGAIAEENMATINKLLGIS